MFETFFVYLMIVIGFGMAAASFRFDSRVPGWGNHPTELLAIGLRPLGLGWGLMWSAPLIWKPPSDWDQFVFGAFALMTILGALAVASAGVLIMRDHRRSYY